MTRITTLTSPLLLGFEEIERMVEKITRTSGDGYPPYNIEKINDNGMVKLRITLAVAGFNDDDLDVLLVNGTTSVCLMRPRSTVTRAVALPGKGEAINSWAVSPT